jgi:hypothetical protein
LRHAYEDAGGEFIAFFSSRVPETKSNKFTTGINKKLKRALSGMLRQ